MREERASSSSELEKNSSRHVALPPNRGEARAFPLAPRPPCSLSAPNSLLDSASAGLSGTLFGGRAARGAIGAEGSRRERLSCQARFFLGGREDERAAKASFFPLRLSPSQCSSARSLGVPPRIPSRNALERSDVTPSVACAGRGRRESEATAAEAELGNALPCHGS